MGISPAIAIAATLASTAATVYSASQANKGPNLPKAPTAPKLPERKSLISSRQQADRMAQTAGGSILSDPKANAGITDGANATRKTLLGT